MSSKNIKGLIVEISGETTKLSDALKDVEKEGSQLQGNLKTVNDLLKLDPSNTEILAEKQKILTDAVSNTREKLDGLKAAQEQIKQQYANGDIDQGAYLKFCAEVAQTEKQLKSYEGQLEDCEKSGNSAGKALEVMAEGAKKAGSALKTISEAGIKTVTAAIDVGAKAFTAYTGAAVGAVTAIAGITAKAALAADDLNTLSTVTGISTEDLQAFQYGADLVDVSLDTLTKSMAKNVKQMTSTSAATVEAYDKLGVATKNADGSLRDSQTVYWECIDALGKIEDETERDSVAMSIFGKSAQELNPLIEGGAEKFKELAESAKESGMILSQDALDGLNAFNDSIDVLKANASSASNVIGSAFVGTFNPITDAIGAAIPSLAIAFGGIFTGENTSEALQEGLTELGSQLVESIGELLPPLLDGFNGVVSAVIGSIADTAPDAIETILPVFFNGFNGLVSTLINQIPRLLPTFINGVSKLFLGLVTSLNSATTQLMPLLPKFITQVCSTLTAALPQFISNSVQLFLGLVQGLSDAVPSLIEQVIILIPTIIDALMESLPLILESGLQITLELAQGIIDALPELISVVPQIVSSITETLTDMLPLLVTMGFDMIVSLADALPDAIVEIVNQLPQIIMSIIKSLTSMLPKIIDAGFTLFVSLIDAMPDIIIAIIDALPQIISAIIETLIDSIPLLIDCSVEMFTALIEGMPRAIPEIIKALPQIIDKIIDVMLSTDWAGLGIDLIKGIAEGFVEGVKSIGSTIEQVGDEIVAKFKDFFGIHSPSRLFRDEVGMYLADGIGEGFTSRMGDITKQMRGAVPTDFSVEARAARASIGNAGIGSSRGETTINYTQINNSPKALDAETINRNTRQGLQLATVMR